MPRFPRAFEIDIDSFLAASLAPQPPDASTGCAVAPATDAVVGELPAAPGAPATDSTG